MDAEHPHRLSPPTTYGLLTVGVVAVSFSAIFIRQAHAPALAMAFWRNLIATALVLPPALVLHREEFRSLTRRDVAVALLSGAFLAAHFITWIPSLQYTTVAASTVLVCTVPVFVAIGSLWVGERVSRGAAVGIAVTLAGAIVVSGGDFGVSSRAVLGDVLALLGAIFAAGYFLIGRNQRQRLPLLVYVTIVYATCTVVLVPAMAVGGARFTGFPAATWGLFVLMAVVPQILGHTVFNFLLRDLDPTVITVAIMGEPVGAALLALAFFSEVPSWWTVLGGVLILPGIYVAVTAQARKPGEVPVPAE
ncbi:MAG: DMT family transporter [Actinomycetota bacterium]|nr:DMT family transporter [Actinomycetota bacterium]